MSQVLVKCGSHRARRKLLSLLGGAEHEALYSLTREVGKGGAYRIPAKFEERAKAITGVSGLRDGEDLMRCWPHARPGAGLMARCVPPDHRDPDAFAGLARRIARREGVERRKVDGIEIKVTREPHGSVVDSPCDCFGIPTRCCSTMRCPWQAKRAS